MPGASELPGADAEAALDLFRLPNEGRGRAPGRLERPDRLRAPPRRAVAEQGQGGPGRGDRPLFPRDRQQTRPEDRLGRPREPRRRSLLEAAAHRVERLLRPLAIAVSEPGADDRLDRSEPARASVLHSEGDEPLLDVRHERGLETESGEMEMGRGGDDARVRRRRLLVATHVEAGERPPDQVVITAGASEREQDKPGANDDAVEVVGLAGVDRPQSGRDRFVPATGDEVRLRLHVIGPWADSTRPRATATSADAATSGSAASGSSSTRKAARTREAPAAVSHRPSRRASFSISS